MEQCLQDRLPVAVRLQECPLHVLPPNAHDGRHRQDLALFCLNVHLYAVIASLSTTCSSRGIRCCRG